MERRPGESTSSTVFEYVPVRFIQHEHIQETLACACAEHIVTAEAPAKVVDKGRCDASFIAHFVTAKCAESVQQLRGHELDDSAQVPRIQTVHVIRVFV